MIICFSISGIDEIYSKIARTGSLDDASTFVEKLFSRTSKSSLGDVVAASKEAGFLLSKSSTQFHLAKLIQRTSIIVSSRRRVSFENVRVDCLPSFLSTGEIENHKGREYLPSQGQIRSQRFNQNPTLCNTFFRNMLLEYHLATSSWNYFFSLFCSSFYAMEENRKI